MLITLHRASDNVALLLNTDTFASVEPAPGGSTIGTIPVNGLPAYVVVETPKQIARMVEGKPAEPRAELGAAEVCALQTMDEPQKAKAEKVRAATAALIDSFRENCPASADRAAAERSARLAMMQGIASIALKGRV